MAQPFPRIVSLITTTGEHVRYIPGALASAMVHSGSATRSSSARSITLAPNRAIRIGEATTGVMPGVRFTRWARLDASAARVIEHHPRCTY